MARESIFHDSWHRVADLKPRLRASVLIARRLARGRIVHILYDRANNTSFILYEGTFTFTGWLDGQHTVREAWNAALATHEGQELTQGEVIRLLAELAKSNLLDPGSVPDPVGMFERVKKRRRRDVQGMLMNLLFPRLPLVDPDAVLERGLFLVGWIFSWPGALLWLLMLSAGLYALISAGPTAGKLLTDAGSLLRPDNWLLLLLAFMLDKLVHESGHAIACKRFGRAASTGGEVHVMGIMLLVFTPVPYVDASSASILPSKWQRAMVGLAGMWVEFALAALAAVTWRLSNPTGTLHAFCYNLMFVASVATVFFNANPFLRYDGYYVLSDLVEIPNLLGRSVNFATYLVRRYLFGLKDIVNPTQTTGQRIWLLVYLVLAGIVRVLVCAGIIVFLVANLKNYPQLTIVLLIMASTAVVTWLVAPVLRGLWYLLANAELAHRRGRAMGISAAVVGLFVVGLGAVPVPNHCRVEGIVRGTRQCGVYAATAGWLHSFVPAKGDGAPVAAGQVVAVLANRKLLQQQATLEATLAATQIKQRKAVGHDAAMVQILWRRIRAIKRELLHVQRRIAALQVAAPHGGTWLDAQLSQHVGSYIKRGQRVGTVLDTGSPLIYAAASQNTAGRITAAATHTVEVRVYGEPSNAFGGSLLREYPGGGTSLPSNALSYAAGGPFAPDLTAHGPGQSASPFFMLVIKPTGHVRLLPGQRVVARVQLPSEPIAEMVFHHVCRLLQPSTGL